MQQPNNFASNLKRLRTQKNITQDKLADELIISRPALGAYEEGRAKPSLDKLINMADYFGITLDALIR